MKTLYININGLDIQSSDDVDVVGNPEDAIVNKFYYELGKEILKGVDASVSRGINKKGIVTTFMDYNKECYDAIWKEWETVKDKLLGENPSGTYSVTLPTEYITWLNNSSQTSYSEIAKSLHSKGGVVEVSIDKIYRNAIGIIVNILELSECNECKQFVVNDSSVTDDSAISLAIMEKLKGIVFVPFDDDDKCPKCGKSPCECEDGGEKDDKCPKCGKNPCECDKTYNNEILIVTYKEVDFDNESLCEGTKEIEVYRSQSSYSIHEGKYKDSSIEHWNGHDYLELKFQKHTDTGYEDFYNEISVLGVVKELDYSDTICHKSYCAEFNYDEKAGNTDDIVEGIKKSNPKYEEVEYVGYSRLKDIHILVGYSHENIQNQSPNGGEVITDKCKLLFKIKDNIVPSSVFPSGLILVEKLNLSFQTGTYGVMDLSGKIVIQCSYMEHSFDNPMRNYSHRPKEIEPGIIEFCSEYVNANNGDKYVEVLKDFYVLSRDEYNFDVDIIEKKTGKTILSHIAINFTEDWNKDWKGGWCMLDTKKLLPDGENWEFDSPLLIHSNSIVKLFKFEEVMSYWVSNDQNERIPFISENRIVSYLLQDGENTVSPECMECINIRDYKGNMIKTIKMPDFFLVRPYMYGKALGYKVIKGDNPLSLMYLDEKGEEHSIPYSVAHIGIQDLDKCFFASPDTIVVKNDGEDVLINLNGSVLFNKKGWIDQLSEGFLKYYNYDGGKYGLVNGKGDTILLPKYDNIDLLK